MRYCRIVTISSALIFWFANGTAGMLSATARESTVVIDLVGNLAISDTVFVKGGVSSLIKDVESFVIIPGNAHEEAWVHPELVTVPGASAAIEFRVRPTDRSGKDKHGRYIYFRTEDSFKNLRHISAPRSPYWNYIGLHRDRLAVNDTLPVPNLGHTWACPSLYLNATTFIQGFTTKAAEGAKHNAVRSLLVRDVAGKLEPLHISDPRTIPVGRGLYEPHIAEYNGRLYMTARAEDGFGYVLTSDDHGRSWSEPVPWRWDDGEKIRMNQTMTKLLSHSAGLVLVYTRIKDDNSEVFRHRAPLHCADIDIETLALKKETELVVVPNKGLPVGNFWVWPINEEASYITTAEWPRDGRLENGDIWLVKIKWRTANEKVRQQDKIANVDR